MRRYTYRIPIIGILQLLGKDILSFVYTANTENLYQIQDIYAISQEKAGGDRMPAEQISKRSDRQVFRYVEQKTSR
ncbi:MAG: hypothetical protein WCR58_04305 [Bacteroidales bacterium]|nr:hypothetical protein [Bacteroidales bacterium]MDY0368540.1 hypothetical protein [Bacteroidales bacterium]